MTPSYLLVDWLLYQSFSQKLAAAILSDNSSFDEIVSISRGGLTLGHILSDYLQIPIYTIAIQSYTDIQKQGKLKITGKLQSDIKNKSILLVDDVADSGKTLKRALSYLKELKPASITTVTMFYKKISAVRPDYYAKETSSWVIFPYESTEMILLMSNKLAKEGKNKAEIQSFLLAVGFNEKDIAFVRRHYSGLFKTIDLKRDISSSE